MKKMILMAFCFIAIASLPLSAQTQNQPQNSEYSYIILSKTGEYKVTIDGPSGKVQMLQLLVTVLNTDASSKKANQKVVFIEDNDENKEILSQTSAFWIDSKARVPKNGDWAAPEGSETSYELIYSWGQILDYPKTNTPTGDEVKSFYYSRLEHIVKRCVSPKKTKVKLYQLLVTKVSDNNGTLSFQKEVAYIENDTKNQDIFNFTSSFFVDFAPMVRDKKTWIRAKDGEKNSFNIIFNYGYIQKILYKSPIPDDPWKNLSPVKKD